MDDLISRKELLKTPWVLPTNMTRKQALECFRNILSEAPAIDAVLVVRCKDCIGWGIGHRDETDYLRFCRCTRFMRPGDWYCAAGKRRCDDAAD